MKIGLLDCDSHNFPNLALMKISAWHKHNGDSVGWVAVDGFDNYDKIYCAKIFGDEYSKMPIDRFLLELMAKEVVYGGSGFAITVENGKEVYHKELDKPLPSEIEHIYPDYSIYPELTKDTAFGFLTRGCCNDCSFCIVAKKEGRCSVKVADLSEWWDGQKHIKLLDPNILACKERMGLLAQLEESGANVDFTQGLDARFITDEVAHALSRIKKDMVHFAFDFMKNEKVIVNGLKTYANICGVDDRRQIVYMLTNYDTSHEEDMYRVRMIRECGFLPYVMIYRKETAPPITKHLQRWCNNRFLFRSCEFEDYAPHKDGKTIKRMFYAGT